MELASVVDVLINGAVAGLIYALIAAGFSLIFGVSKVMFFAHGEMYMLGVISGFLFLGVLGLT